MEASVSGLRSDRGDSASDGIVTEIRRRLWSTGRHALRHVECEYSDDTVVLRGRVPTYYCKQLAQSVLLPDALANTVVNLIEVSDNRHLRNCGGTSKDADHIDPAR
jgi:hypothetical protein